MFLNGVRYCDCCGIKLNSNNNKCGYELCDRCNERLEDKVRQNIEIHCNYTNKEIARSFRSDVEAVKDLLPKAESEE